MIKSDVVIIGTGNIAFKHALIIKKLYPNKILCLYNYRKKKFNKKNIEENKILKNFDYVVNDGTKITPKDSMSFVIVASPANYHIKHSLFFAKKRFHILVEKPLTTNKTLLNSFLSEFKKNNFIFHVGYNMRFLTSIIMMKKIIKTKKYGDIVHANITAFSNFINWRPNKNYKTTVSALRDLGGGVVNELSHEIDYMIHLFGFPYKSISRIMYNKEYKFDAEDSCNSRFLYKKFKVNLFLNMLSSFEKRTCFVKFKNASVLMDIQKNIIQIYKKEKIHKVYSLNHTMEDTYTKQIKYFIKKIKNKKYNLHEIENSIILSKMLNNIRSIN